MHPDSSLTHQDVNNRTRGVTQMTANTIDELGNGDSTEHEENRKRDVASLPLERFVYIYLSFHYEIISSPDYNVSVLSTVKGITDKRTNCS